MGPLEQLRQARQREEAERLKDAARRRAFRAEFDRTEVLLEREIYPYLRPATADEYSAWLQGHLENGGTITHYRDRLTGGIVIATASFFLPNLFGAQSIDLIVPGGLDVTTEGGFTHNTVYFMDGFRVVGLSGAEAFKDTRLTAPLLKHGQS